MQEKTLVILIGNARGGEQTWKTLYKNLIDIYEADLLLCFGKTEHKQNTLYQKANYIFELDEYSDWSEYYNIYFNNNWKNSFLCGKDNGLAGGLELYNGSGAIIFAFRHFLKTQCLDIINLYDRIILTRSDYFYLYHHPILPNDRIWIPEGEDYGGITDRCHIFPSKLYKEILGVVEYMDSDIGFKQISQMNPNPEQVLKVSFEFYNILNLVHRYKRCQFTVATQNDTTRWQKANIKLLNYDDLYIKYINEYTLAINNAKHYSIKPM